MLVAALDLRPGDDDLGDDLLAGGLNRGDKTMAKRNASAAATLSPAADCSLAFMASVAGLIAS